MELVTTLIVQKAPVGQHYNLEKPGKETTTVAIINLLQCQRSFHKQDMIHGLFVTCKPLTYSGEGSGPAFLVDFDNILITFKPVYERRY